MLWQPTRGVLQPGQHWRRPQGTAAAFSPADIANLKIWLDANVGITQSGGLVSQWDDQSGNNNHLTQGNSSQQPTYSATGFNGALPGVTFANASPNDRWLRVTNAAISSASLSVFMALRQTTAMPNNAGFLSCHAAGQGDDVSGGGLAIEHSGGNYRVQAGSYDRNGPSVILNTPTTVSWLFDGSTGTDFINFSVGSSNTHTETFGNTTFTVNIGSRPFAGNGFGFNGELGEFLMYAGTLTAGEKSSLHTYLTNKWGVT